jgi:hypothetical protein
VTINRGAIFELVGDGDFGRAAPVNEILFDGEAFGVLADGAPAHVAADGGLFELRDNYGVYWLGHLFFLPCDSFFVLPPLLTLDLT